MIKIVKINLLVLSLIVFVFSANAQDMGTGTGWATINPTEPIVIDDNFQGFEFFHTDENPDQGNSENKIDELSGAIVGGYKDFDHTFNYLNSTVAVTYSFIQCAFAPEWKAAYAFKDGVANTTNVSNGFVEISRPDEVYSNPPTFRGYLTVDLRGLDYVEAIQYSHSSCGGSKRGLLVEYSKDDGTTWDSLRYQPADGYLLSFTTDVFSGDRTPNNINCSPSAMGMLWEDGIYDSNMMIRFTAAGYNTIQTVRIHDLKVYGTVGTGNAAKQIANNVDVKLVNKQLNLSSTANVEVYNLAGSIIKSANQVTQLSLENLKNGVYIVKVNSGNQLSAKKIIVR